MAIAEIEPANHFQGVALNDGKRAKILEYLNSVLGEDFYAEAEGFFVSIWESTAKYKVFLVRRCFNLMYSFFRGKYANNNTKITDTFYTDSSILANSAEIGDFFIVHKFFPKIMIVDDLLIHGRTISGIIESLIDNVYGYLRETGIEESESVIADELLKSLSIHVIAMNNKPMLLRSNFYQRLVRDPKSKDVLIPQRWHELSSRISLSAADGYFSNTSYVLSLHETKGKEQLHQEFEDAALRLGFEKYEWNRRFDYEVLTKPLYNTTGNVAAFYTLRISQNNVDQRYRIAPLIIMSDFRYDQNENMSGGFLKFDKILNSFSSRCGDKRLKSELLYLLLSHNLLLLLQEEIGKNVFDCNDLDVDKIGYTFKINENNSGTKLINLVAGLTSPILSWEEMESLILDATSGSEALFENTKNDSRITLDGNLLEDIIADNGWSIEYIAYKEYSRQYGISSTAKKGPILRLFNDLKEDHRECFGNKNINFADAIGTMMKLTDTGAMSIGVLERGDAVCCAYRAGEQSQFIYPKRYADEMRVLIEIEHDCLFDPDWINKRIDEFYAEDPNPNLAQELKDFVNDQYESGQRIADWRINFFKWTEVDEDFDDDDDKRFEKREKAKEEAMYHSFDKQLRKLELYRERYPV